MILVVDASAVLEVLLQTAAGAPMTPRLLRRDTTLHTPHLLDLEVAQVLRRFERRDPQIGLAPDFSGRR
jgi:predicted nucleic acid-binding protein